MYTYICIYICTYKHVYMYVCVGIHTYHLPTKESTTYIYIYVYVYVRVSIHIHPLPAKESTRFRRHPIFSSMPVGVICRRGNAHSALFTACNSI